MRKGSSFKRQSILLGAVVSLCWGIVLLIPRTAYSQATSATFYGHVNDPSEAAVPKAEVTITEQDTQASRKTVAGSDGDFTFTFVPPGIYTLRITAQGFKAYVATGITLTAGQQARQTYKLELGAVTQTINVEGAAPLVNTVSAQKLHPYSEMEVRQLPLPNRNFTAMIHNQAGVTPSIGNDATGVDINGMGRNGTQYSTDGISATGNVEGNNPSFYQAPNLVDIMSIEGIQEVNVIKGYVPPEYEDTLGGQVNLITKSGTNDWHGSLFENYQSSGLNARDQILSERPKLVFNQWGGSIGGPIVKNKVFIFGDLEQYRQVSKAAVRGDTPTPAFRQQLLTAVPGLKPALDQFPEPVPGSFSPGDMTALFTTARAATRRDNHVDIKGDVMLTTTSRLSLTYRHGEPLRLIPRYFVDDPRTWENTVNGGSASFVTGRANWTSETRVGFNKPDQIRLDKFFDTMNPTGRQETFPFGERFPRFSLSGVLGGPDAELDDLRGSTWSVSEKYARHMGRHSFKFGGDVHKTSGLRNNPEIPFLGFSTLDDLLNNQPDQFTATLGSGDFIGSAWEFGLFAQDDWRYSRKLTLNLGMRYDFYSAVHSVGQGLTPEAGIFNPAFLTQDGNFEIGPFRPTNSPYHNDPVNFGPRFGFSYNPDGQGKTAIRGGAGVMFSNIPQGWFWIGTFSEPNLPFRVRFTRQDIVANNLQFPSFNDDAVAIARQNIQNNPNARNIFEVINAHMQNPYTIQFTLDIQRQLGHNLMFESGIVGTSGVKLPLSRFFNKVNRDTGLRPNPLIPEAKYIDNSSHSTYYGWQNTLKKRFSKSLSFDINYTWSKVLSTGGGDTGSYFDGENFEKNQEFFDLKADRGPTSYDITHVFAADWVYQAPYLQSFSSPALRGVLGGWTFSGIFSAFTGLPAFLGQRSARGQDRPDFIGGNAVLDNFESTLQYLNPAAFASVPLDPDSGASVRPGNVGPGEFRGPGRWTVDFAIGRTFPLKVLGEGGGLQMRANMFNALNHTNLTGLRTNTDDSRFGQLLGTAGARTIQLEGRITF